MFGSGGSIDTNLLTITNELDNLNERFIDKIPKDHKKEFKQEIESLREELFHLINLSKKIRDVIERSY